MIDLFLCGCRVGVFLLGALGLVAVVGVALALCVWKLFGVKDEKTYTVTLTGEEYDKLSKMLDDYYDDGK